MTSSVPINGEAQRMPITFDERKEKIDGFDGNDDDDDDHRELAPGRQQPQKSEIDETRVGEYRSDLIRQHSHA